MVATRITVALKSCSMSSIPRPQSCAASWWTQASRRHGRRRGGGPHEETEVAGRGPARREAGDVGGLTTPARRGRAAIGGSAGERGRGRQGEARAPGLPAELGHSGNECRFDTGNWG
jgi:hypothetical protein